MTIEEPSASTGGFRRDIEGLRAVAVGAVVLYHAGVPAVSGGYVGVDVFFVISGFLITSHLAEELDRRDTVSFRRFYARRARRILPVALVVLVATLLGALWALPALQIDSVVGDAVAAATYVPNVLFAVRGTDYLADPTPSPYQHYWSLGIEEQFYLVWPLALWAVWRLARGRRLLVSGLVAALVAGSFVLGVVALGRSQPFAFFLLPMRAWELGIGALLALVVGGAGRRTGVPGGARRWLPGLTTLGGWVGLAAIVATVLVYDAETRFPGLAAAVPVLGAALVIGCGTWSGRAGPAGLLSIRPAQALGRLSYSVYLWHWPLLVLAAQRFGPLDAWERGGLVLLAIGLSMASYRWVEQPPRLTPRLRERPGATIGLALGASGVAVALALGVGAVWSRLPLHAGVEVAAAPLRTPPQVTDVVPRNLTPSLRDAEADLPAVYARGCHLEWPESQPTPCQFGPPDADRTAVLFGDSHAAQWLPAVRRYATDNGFRLVTHTKRSCPSVDMPKVNQGNPFVACDRWREAVLDELREAPPDLVVISNARQHERRDRSIPAVEAWTRGLASTLDRLPASTRVVVIADTPIFPDRTPPLCLSANLRETTACGIEREVALDAGWAAAERRTAEEHGAVYVDLNRYLCDARCEPVIGSYLVYRDRNHLTTAMAAALAEPLADDLRAAGLSWTGIDGGSDDEVAVDGVRGPG